LWPHHFLFFAFVFISLIGSFAPVAFTHC
jgi:hypothetical protein